MGGCAIQHFAKEEEDLVLVNRQTDSESLIDRDAPIESQLFLDQPIPERGISLLAAAGIEGSLGVADGGRLIDVEDARSMETQQ